MLVLAPEIKPCFDDDASIAFQQIMRLDGDVLRHMDGRTTKRIQLNGKPYYIKQHLGVGPLEIIKNYVQLKSPVVSARNEWLALNLLGKHNILAPKVLGHGQQGLNPAKKESFVILEAIEPATSLETLTKSWLTQKPNFAFKRALIHAVADMTAKMHAIGINHRDLYICHFLLKSQTTLHNNELPLYLIDLHRAQIRTTVPMRWRIKDLAGLYFSSLHIGLTKRDRLRFMKRYSKQTLRETLTKDNVMWHKTYLRGEQLNRDHQ